MTITRRLALALTPALLAPRGARAQPPRAFTMLLASTSFATAPARLARELGLFDRHGLAPRFVVLDSANAATAALIARSGEVALSGPGELIAAQVRNQPVVAVANAYKGLSGSLVLGRDVAARLGGAEAGVDRRLRALEGLVIGGPSATGAYSVALKAAAKALGVTFRNTYMAQPTMPAALESGAIQGFIAGAPFWSVPVVKGTGVLWLSGPKGDIPAEFAPSSSADLQMLRDVALANPDLVKALVAVSADLAEAIDARPAAVRAALARLYPDLDAPTLDLLFGIEAQGWKDRPPSVAGLAHEIAFIRASGSTLPGLDRLDPAAMLVP